MLRLSSYDASTFSSFLWSRSAEGHEQKPRRSENKHWLWSWAALHVWILFYIVSLVVVGDRGLQPSPPDWCHYLVEHVWFKLMCRMLRRLFTLVLENTALKLKSDSIFLHNILLRKLSNKNFCLIFTPKRLRKWYLESHWNHHTVAK